MNKTPSDIPPLNIGERLKAARLAQDLTQEKLAAWAGFSRWTVIRAEKGELKQLDVLERLAEGLGLELTLAPPPPPAKMPAR